MWRIKYRLRSAFNPARHSVLYFIEIRLTEFGDVSANVLLQAQVFSETIDIIRIIKHLTPKCRKDLPNTEIFHEIENSFRQTWSMDTRYYRPANFSKFLASLAGWRKIWSNKKILFLIGEFRDHLIHAGFYKCSYKKRVFLCSFSFMHFSYCIVPKLHRCIVSRIKHTVCKAIC